MKVYRRVRYAITSTIYSNASTFRKKIERTYKLRTRQRSAQNAATRTEKQWSESSNLLTIGKPYTRFTYASNRKKTSI